MNKATFDVARFAWASVFLATTVWAQNPAPAATPAAEAPAAAPTRVAPPFREDFGETKAGDDVVDFVVQNVNGKAAKLSGYAAGKVTVFALWSAGSAGSPAMMEQWESLWKKYGGAAQVRSIATRAAIRFVI